MPVEVGGVEVRVVDRCITYLTLDANAGDWSLHIDTDTQSFLGLLNNDHDSPLTLRRL